LAHRLDESPADYSLAGWSPPEPASASPAASSMNQNRNAGYDLSANGNLSPYKLSQLWGAVQATGTLAILAKPADGAGVLEISRVFERILALMGGLGGASGGRRARLHGEGRGGAGRIG